MNDFLPPDDANAAPKDDGPDNDDQMSRLIVQYLNDALNEDEVRRLGRKLDGNARLQTLFVRLARLHGMLSEWGRFQMAENRGPLWNLLDEQDDAFDLGEPARASLHDAVVQPALNAADLDRPEDVAQAPVIFRPNIANSSRSMQWWRAAAVTSAAAGLALACYFGLRSGGAPHQNNVAVAPVAPPVAAPPAVITSAAAAVLGNAPLQQPGVALALGKAIDLTAGAIEITFDSGAIVAVTAPARLRVLGPNHMALDSGSLAARVPPSGVGFRVDGVDMTVIDQGTEFGMRPDALGAGTELAVFKGAVDAQSAGSARPTTAPAGPRAVHVTAGNAVVCVAGSNATPTKYTTEGYVRTIEDYRMSLELPGTAATTRFDEQDPNWLLVSDPGGALNQPKAVYAVEMRPAFFYAASPSSKWVSPAPREADAASGRFTFRTVVTLPEFVPGTASVTGIWGVDDQLVDVIVNGNSTAAANPELVAQTARLQPFTWTLRGANWKPGRNQVEVVIFNKVSPAGVLNQTSLNVSWTFKFLPVVQRSNGAANVAPPPGN